MKALNAEQDQLAQQEATEERAARLEQIRLERHRQNANLMS